MMEEMEKVLRAEIRRQCETKSNTDAIYLRDEDCGLFIDGVIDVTALARAARSYLGLDV